MKKHLFDLQLFAEVETASSAESDAAAAEQGKATEEKKPVTAASQSKPEAKYTDDDVNKLLNQKFAEWQKKKEKEVGEAQKLATMNATQKAEYERDQIKKELEEYKKQASLAEMSKTARKMLSDDGITISDELLAMLVTTNADDTKNAVDGFSKAFKEAVESAVKERLKGQTPRKGSGGTVAMTKEQIMAIKDPELRQKKMLENKTLFNF